jgi:hypothetical protein
MREDKGPITSFYRADDLRLYETIRKGPGNWAQLWDSEVLDRPPPDYESENEERDPRTRFLLTPGQPEGSPTARVPRERTPYPTTRKQGNHGTKEEETAEGSSRGDRAPRPHRIHKKEEDGERRVRRGIQREKNARQSKNGRRWWSRDN